MRGDSQANGTITLTNPHYIREGRDLPVETAVEDAPHALVTLFEVRGHVCTNDHASSGVPITGGHDLFFEDEVQYTAESSHAIEA